MSSMSPDNNNRIVKTMQLIDRRPAGWRAVASGRRRRRVMTSPGPVRVSEVRMRLLVSSTITPTYARVDGAFGGFDVRRRRDGELSRTDCLSGTHISNDSGRQVVVVDGIRRDDGGVGRVSYKSCPPAESVFRIRWASDHVGFNRRVHPGHESTLTGS